MCCWNTPPSAGFGISESEFWKEGDWATYGHQKRQFCVGHTGPRRQPQTMQLPCPQSVLKFSFRASQLELKAFLASDSQGGCRLDKDNGRLGCHSVLSTTVHGHQFSSQTKDVFEHRWWREEWGWCHGCTHHPTRSSLCPLKPCWLHLWCLKKERGKKVSFVIRQQQDWLTRSEAGSWCQEKPTENTDRVSHPPRQAANSTGWEYPIRTEVAHSWGQRPSARCLESGAEPAWDGEDVDPPGLFNVKTGSTLT